MDISVELTFSPLQDDYQAHIITFIQRLRASGIKMEENALATQVYGDYDGVMEVLNYEIKRSFEEIGIGLFYLKLVKTDRSDYARDY